MTFVIAWILAVWIVPISHPAVCPSKTAPYRLFSTRTSYDVVGGRQENQEEIPGCEVRQIYHLVRHGTRYPGRDEIEAMITTLPQLRGRLLQQTHHGCLANETIQDLKKWLMKFRPEDDLRIAHRGLREMYDIATRMRKRFPTFFSQINSSAFDIRHTFNFRSLLSANYFVGGLLNMDYSSLQYDNESRGYSLPHDKDFLLLFCDLCFKYVKERLKEDDKEALLFDNGPEVTHIVEYTNSHLGLPPKTLQYDTIKAMFEACRFQYAIFGETTWCDILPVKAIKVLEYRQDMKYYWRYGFGREINYQPSCLILKEILEVFSKATSAPFVQSSGPILRFGHSRSILPLVVRLGLYNDSEPLLASTFQIHEQRQWRLSKINPFSSNIFFVFYHCEGQFRVRTFLNEHEFYLSGCRQRPCSLEDLQEAWTDVVGQCNFEKLCDQQGKLSMNMKDLNMNAFHHA